MKILNKGHGHDKTILKNVQFFEDVCNQIAPHSMKVEVFDRELVAVNPSEFELSFKVAVSPAKHPAFTIKSAVLKGASKKKIDGTARHVFGKKCKLHWSEDLEVTTLAYLFDSSL